MEEKNIEFYRFTKARIDDPDKLDERLDNLTKSQQIALAKLAHKIKPVFRCSVATKVEEIFNYKVTEFNKSPKIISSISADGRLEVKSEPHHVYKGIVYDIVKVPEKLHIMGLKQIINEESEDYLDGFFAYAKGGYSIFNGFLAHADIVCKAPKLEKICEIATLHYSPYAESFMPSESEVLIQIPEVLKNVVAAYELYLPQANPENMIANYKAHNQHHKAYARLFRLADGETEPDEIKKYYDEISIEDTIG